MIRMAKEKAEKIEDEKITLDVEGMTCNNCASGISKHLKNQGFKNVTADFSTSEVRFLAQEEEDIQRAVANIEEPVNTSAFPGNVPPTLISGQSICAIGIRNARISPRPLPFWQKCLAFIESRHSQYGCADNNRRHICLHLQLNGNHTRLRAGVLVLRDIGHDLHACLAGQSDRAQIGSANNHCHRRTY
ncbi:MAG: hypothetical protein BRD50_02510 [Bacteroidetes bacterium SW_11_45_7]|nr:MAG: hypothetical protein BRD50_02510 [Bacteroidetes bacterium SW_11_45_7]